MVNSESVIWLYSKNQYKRGIYMFNYHDLNDVEFEELCKDVMGKILNTKLRVFATGRDGGVDLTDNVDTLNIVVQVKHYINSDFSNLRTSLKKEIPKVKQLNPNQYFICCAKRLTKDNIKEIYKMFSNYMASDKNIFTLIEIDDFLQDENNSDIVRKHYKLWLSATTILNEINNRNIFIDCESLLSDIEEERKFFVQTTAYDLCKEHLEKHRLIMLLGSPGVGKTTLSKMLVIYFADCGYSVRYTTNGDISDIKRSLSSNREQKEIVLLDDCLGQHYFKMIDSQESELLALIKYIKVNPKKLLILNSRITIFNEAKERSIDFKIYINRKKIDIYTLNMDQISLFEKAKIFYNHLTFNDIPKEYLTSIKTNKNYMEIVKHPNYTPRIIEHVTLINHYSKIKKPEDYFSYINSTLANPVDIWKDEFNRRLTAIDRVFLNTLYSLTDTNIDSNILQECFEKRLTIMPNIDCTINNYENVLVRLSQSIVKIIDYRDKKHIGVINPSVNDYLKPNFYSNSLELGQIKSTIIYYEQLVRCYSNQDNSSLLQQKIIDDTILDLKFSNERTKYDVILSMICMHKICNKIYMDYIYKFLNSHYNYDNLLSGHMLHSTILKNLLEEPLYSYYKMEDAIKSVDLIENILESLSLDDLIKTVNILSDHLENSTEIVSMLEEKIHEEIDIYLENIDLSDFCDRNDVFNAIDDNLEYNDEEQILDTRRAVSILQKKIKNSIESDLNNTLKKLNFIYVDFKEVDIDEYEHDIEGLITDGLKSFNDLGNSSNNSTEKNMSEIEIMFERF